MIVWVLTLRHWAKINLLWPTTIKIVESGEICNDALLHARKAIRQTTGWSDPVHALFVHAYIAKIQHDTVVEEKSKRDEANEGSSKRPMRLDQGRQQTVAIREETMKDVTSTFKDKGKAPACKLLSDIEASTDLKKVLEERILNGNLEFTLGEVFGIAKQEFHEVIIDIIKRKRQAMGANLTSSAHKTKVMRDEENDKEIYGDVSQMDFIKYEDEKPTRNHFFHSHFFRSQWARATTETFIKIGQSS